MINILGKKIDFFTVAVIAFTVVYSCCATVNAENSEYIKVFVLDFHYNTLVVFIFVCFSFITIINKVSLDAINVLLVLHAFFQIIPLIYNDASITYNLGYYITNINIVLVYTYCNKKAENLHLWVRFLAFFAIIIVFEVLLSYSRMEIDWNSQYYKYFIGIPLGKSNTIGVFLLPIYGLIESDCARINGKQKRMILGWILLGIIMVKSRSAIIALVFYYFIKYYHYLISRRNVLKILACSGLLLSAVFALGKIDEVIKLFLGNYDVLSSRGYSFFNSITSDRLTVAANVFADLGRHFLFGNGLDYSHVNNTFAHNLILDVWYQSGFVGLVIYLAVIIMVLKKIYSVNKELVCIPLLVLFQSMFEPSLTLFPSDFIFWIVGGALSSKEIVER